MALKTIYNDATIASNIKHTEEYKKLSDVMLREEDLRSPFNPLPDIFSTYVNTNVLKYTGINFKEFLNIPIATRDVIIESCREQTTKDAIINEEIQKQAGVIDA